MYDIIFVEVKTDMNLRTSRKKKTDPSSIRALKFYFWNALVGFVVKQNEE